MNHRNASTSMALLPREPRAVAWSWVGAAAGAAAIAGVTLGLLGNSAMTLSPANSPTPSPTHTMTASPAEPSTPPLPHDGLIPSASAMNASDWSELAPNWTLETVTTDGEPLHVYLTAPNGTRMYATYVTRSTGMETYIPAWDPAAGTALGYREVPYEDGPLEWFILDLRTGEESTAVVPSALASARDVSWLGRASDGKNYGVVQTQGANDAFTYAVVSWDAGGFGDVREYNSWDYTDLQPHGDLVVVSGYTDRPTHAVTNLVTGEVQNFELDKGCGVGSWISESGISVTCGESQHSYGERFRMDIDAPGPLVPVPGEVTLYASLEMLGFAQLVGTPLVVTGTDGYATGIDLLTIEGRRSLSNLEIPMNAWDVSAQYVGGSVYALFGSGAVPIYVNVTTGDVTDLRWSADSPYDQGLEYTVIYGNF